jgi:hypothetical protein
MLKFAATPIVRKGEVGQNFSGKKDVYERYLLCVNLANSKVQEETQLRRPLWVYCTLSYSLDNVNISRRGLSSWVSLYKARREPTHGIGEVEHPRLSV